MGDRAIQNRNCPCYFRTAAYIRLHARRRPGRIAVVADGRRVTYAVLDRDLNAMAQALRALALPAGARVAVGHGDLYVQMLLVFGFEMLGITTGSFRPMEGEESHGLLAAADMTVTQTPPVAPTQRLFIVTGAWLEAVLAAPAAPLPIPRAAAAEAALILRSSGTTGRPKRMLLTHRMLNTRLAQHSGLKTRIGLHDGARFFTIMHFSIVSTVLTAINFLRRGGTFMFDTVRDVLPAMLDLQPTRMTMLPLQLRRLMGTLPPAGQDGPLFPQLVLRTVGAPIDEKLRENALRRLCGAIVNGYGSNEGGRIAAIDGAGIGTITHGIEVEAVDEAGSRLGFGEVGLLRLRGAGVVDAYLDDERASAEMFRDGWFYPGDIGAILAPRLLKLLGRRSDVLNLGGIKTGCAELEGSIMAAAPVRDVAVWQADDAVPQIVVCVVPARPIDRPTLARAIAPVMTAPFSVCVVTAIPRTPNGKIRRAALRELIAAVPETATASS